MMDNRTGELRAGRDEMPSLNDLRDWAGRWLDEHRAEAAQARRYAALLRSPEAPDDPFGTAEESEADAESADAEAAMYAAVLALLAQQEAPADGISLSAQLSQAAAWMRVWDECQRLGMDTYGAPSTSTGLDIVLDFIRGRAAPQETREPEVLTVEKPMTLTYPCGCVATYRLSETVRFCGANEHSPNALRGDAFVLLGAPARQVLALDAIRDVLGIDYDEDSAMWYLPAEPAPIECATLDDALRAYAKMAAPSIPARPDADHDPEEGAGGEGVMR